MVSLAQFASRQAAKNPKLLFGAQHFWLKAGYKFLDLRMAAWAIGRPEWLIKKSQKELKELAPSSPMPASAYMTIAQRMIDSVHLPADSNDPFVPATSMWKMIRETHYETICALVEQKDAGKLAEYLTTVFRTKTVDGYTYGTWLDRLPHQQAYLAVNIELSVVTLAEYLAILRPEQHEQGNYAYWRIEYTEQQLMEELEAFFGFRIEQPRVGDPRGIVFGGRFLTRETCTHLYSALRMREAIDRHNIKEPIRIVEIGGGYGGTCYWLLKVLAGRLERYTIIDLPEVALIQALFLGMSTPDALTLRGEARSSKGGPVVELLSHTQLDAIEFVPNVVINQDSMPEMDEKEVRRYIAWAERVLDGIFISFNHEAYAPYAGVPQVHVPKIFRQFNGFERTSRETSWSRRGYVEEVYRTCALK
jgi:putative sugar O-methyltransferase